MDIKELFKVYIGCWFACFILIYWLSVLDYNGMGSILKGHPSIFGVYLNGVEWVVIISGILSFICGLTGYVLTVMIIFIIERFLKK